MVGSSERRPTVNANEFERRLRALQTGAGHSRANVSCVACESSTSCTGSTFCDRSRELTSCHHCVECERCAMSSHCIECRDCIELKHGIRSTGCLRSQYLVLCERCTDCSFCFGCVGLHARDYHILNEPYDRETYFRLTNELKRALRLT